MRAYAAKAAVSVKPPSESISSGDTHAWWASVQKSSPHWLTVNW